MKKLISLILLAAMLFSLAACAAEEKPEENTDKPGTVEPEVKPEPQPEPEKSHYPVTIKTHNYAKEEVEFTFEKAPQRVLTFWSNSLELMLALGLGDRVVCAVGMNEDSILPELKPELEKMKNTEYYTSFTDSNAAMSREAALMLEPDFILGWKSSFSDKTIGDVDYWHSRGIGTYMALNSNDVSAQRTLANEYEDILTLGKIFDVEDRAEKLVNDMKEGVEKVTSQIKDQPKQTVLVVEFMKTSIWTYDETNLAGDMVKAMGGDLINAPRKIGPEDLVNLNPDVLIIIGNEEKAQAFRDNPGYASMKCRQNNRITPISLSEVYTSGARTILGLNHIGQALYPDLYPAK